VKAKHLHDERRQVLALQPEKSKHGYEHSKTMGQLAQVTKHGGSSRKAMDILFCALDGAVKRYEHALVWGVLNALGNLVTYRNICQQVLMTGFLPLLQKTIQVYEGLEGRLPSALPRPGGRDKIFSKEPPAFPTVQRISALHKQGDTVKESWLKESQSLPNLEASRRVSSLGWLAEATSELDQPVRLRSTMSSTQPGQFNSMNSTCGSTFSQDEFPSLMWLTGEDGVHVESFNRVCDRNFILLKVRRILQHIEKVRSDLTSFLGHTGVGKMREQAQAQPRATTSGSTASKRVLDRGGRSTSHGSRPHSRQHQLSRDQLNQSAEQSQKMLEEVTQKIQADHMKRQQPPPLSL